MLLGTLGTLIQMTVTTISTVTYYFCLTDLFSAIFSG